MSNPCALPVFETKAVRKGILSSPVWGRSNIGQFTPLTGNMLTMLRGSNTDAQSVHGSLSPAQNFRVRLMDTHSNPLNKLDYSESRGLTKSLIGLDYNESLELANWLILLNSVASTESDEGEQYSGSPEHYLHSGSAEHKQCSGSAKEKGSTANAALWDVWFFNHEENQEYPDLDFDRVTERCADNLPSLRGEALRLQVTQSHLQNSSGVAQNYSGISVEPHCPDHIGSVNYEIFVGQSLGSSFAFLRCSAYSLRPHASSTHEEKFALGLAAFSRSTLVSISSISSCGKRIFFFADLLLVLPLDTLTPRISITLTKTPICVIGAITLTVYWKPSGR